MALSAFATAALLNPSPHWGREAPARKDPRRLKTFQRTLIEATWTIHSCELHYSGVFFLEGGLQDCPEPCYKGRNLP